MGQLGRRPFTFSRVLLGGLICTLTAAILAACGGGGTRGGAVASEEQAEIGKMVTAGAWEVTLIGLAERVNPIGEGDITYQAEQGTFIVVPLKVTYAGEKMDVIPRDLVRLRDSEGTEYPATKGAIEIAYVLQRGGETILDTPMVPGASREGVVIFDVSPRATGVTAMLKDTEDTIALGF